jgi:hypothetical protein
MWSGVISCNWPPRAAFRLPVGLVGAVGSCAEIIWESFPNVGILPTNQARDDFIGHASLRSFGSPYRCNGEVGTMPWRSVARS